jgi:hypothetical protein
VLFRTPGREPPGALLGSAGTDLITLASAAIRGADAYAAVRRAVHLEEGVVRVGNRFFRRDQIRELAFLAVGNAAVAMATALDAALGDLISQGLILSAVRPRDPPEFSFVHVPDPTLPCREGQRAAEQVRELLGSLTDRDLLVPLISPGALGALAEPPKGVPWEEYRSILEPVLQSPLGERLLPEVMGRLSPLQGGGLLRMAPKTPVEALVVERGDGGQSVGAGPTISRFSPAAHAVRARLKEAGLWDSWPAWAREALETEPSKPRSASIEAHTVVVAGPSDALEEAGAEANHRDRYSRLVSLHDEAPPDGAAERLLSAVEEYAPSLSNSRTRGYALFQGLSLGRPEGAEDFTVLADFLGRIHRDLRRREVAVLVFRTAGSLPPPRGAAGGIASAQVPLGPPGSGTVLDLEPGFTDVGPIAIAWIGPPGSGTLSQGGTEDGGPEAKYSLRRTHSS